MILWEVQECIVVAVQVEADNVLHGRRVAAVEQAATKSVGVALAFRATKDKEEGR